MRFKRKAKVAITLQVKCSANAGYVSQARLEFYAKALIAQRGEAEFSMSVSRSSLKVQNLC